MPLLFLKEVLSLPDNVQEFKNRERVEGVTLTIDSYDTQDLDDGLSFHREDDGTLVISVSVADVAAWIKPGTALDTAASRRVDSRYPSGYVQPMLPLPLSEDILSLHGDVDRLTQTVEMHFSPDGEYQSVQFKRTVFHNDHRIDTKDANLARQGKGRGAEHPELADAMQQLSRVALKIKGSQNIDSGMGADKLLATFLSFSGKQIAKALVAKGIESSFRNQIQQNTRSSYDAFATGHAAFDGDPYVQWTSPIRRYTDLDVHRSLSRLIDNKPLAGQMRKDSHERREAHHERANNGREPKLNSMHALIKSIKSRNALDGNE